MGDWDRRVSKEYLVCEDLDTLQIQSQTILLTGLWSLSPDRQHTQIKANGSAQQILTARYETSRENIALQTISIKL